MIDLREVLFAWRARPEVFAKRVLGIELWHKQAEILRAIRMHDRIAVASCHKAGKSTFASVAALYFISCYPQARVIFTAPTHRQVKEILWRETKRIVAMGPLRYTARAPTSPSPTRNPSLVGWPVPHINPDDGLQLPDGRCVIGFSTTDPERMAGFSGPNQLIIADEASGISDELHDAIDSARAGGARVLCISNPTRPEGYFFDAFHANSAEWKTFQISAYDVPTHIRGLVRREWADQKLREWGPTDSRYRVRVLGQFPATGDSDAVVPAYLIREASMRQADRTGEICIGVDPARKGDDCTGIAVRLGQAIVEITQVAKMDTQEVCDIVVGFVLRYGLGKPVQVNVDGVGLGAGVVDGLRRRAGIPMLVHEIQVARNSTSHRYNRLKDQMAFAFRYFLEEGGSIPADTQLKQDLSAYRYTHDDRDRLKISAKNAVREAIGRSPDRADACFLAAWTGSRLTGEGREETEAKLRAATSPRDRGRGIYIPDAYDDDE